MVTIPIIWDDNCQRKKISDKINNWHNVIEGRLYISLILFATLAKK